MKNIGCGFPVLWASNARIVLCAWLAVAAVVEAAAVPRSANDATVTQQLAQHLARLESRIGDLEQRVTAAASSGRGAYRSGPSLRVDLGQNGDETLLERLRRLESELSQARGLLASREALIDQTRAAWQRSSAEQSSASARADALEHVRDHLLTAQQVLAERQAQIETLTADLASAELARLKSEREHFRLAAAVLRLSGGQTAELADVQEQIRQQARGLLAPAPAAPGAARAAPSAAPLPTPEHSPPANPAHAPAHPHGHPAPQAAP